LIRRATQINLQIVTTTLLAHGKVTIPSEIRKQLKLKIGDGFDVLCSASGQVMLVPIRRGRKKGLFDALRALKGLELKPNREPIRDIEL